MHEAFTEGLENPPVQQHIDNKAPQNEGLSTLLVIGLRLDSLEYRNK
jgi:hypothetical protein